MQFTQLLLAIRLKNMRFVILICLMGMCFDTNAQELFDSLLVHYSDQSTFPKRKEWRKQGGLNSYLNEELAKHDDEKTKQLAICAMVSNLYGFGWMDNDFLANKLEEVINNPQSDNIELIANRVHDEIAFSLVNKSIIEIVLPNAGGDSIQLSSLFSNYEYTIVDLWATWCKPCLVEMKNFNNLIGTYNVMVYSISFDDNISKIQKFQTKKPDYQWPIVFAGRNSTLWDYFRIRELPAYYLVDANGKVVSKVLRNKLQTEIIDLHGK